MRKIVTVLVVCCCLSGQHALAQRSTGGNAVLSTNVYVWNAHEGVGRTVVLSTNVWKAAEGVLPGRMITQEGSRRIPLYRTIWNHSDGDILVCLRYPGVECFGTPYDIVLVNTSMQIIRRGEITAGQDDTPYCIAEVMADDERLPAGLRNKWLLAVGFWNNHFQRRYRLTHAEGATNFPAGVEAELAKLPAGFYLELVRWSDSEVKPQYGSGNLYRIPNLKVRWIEIGPNLLSLAKQDLSEPYRFEMPKAHLKAESKRAEPAPGHVPSKAAADGGL